jgi:hypothetical protein
LSLEAVHVRLIDVDEAGLAVKEPGVVGGCVSDVVGLNVTVAPAVSTASTRIRMLLIPSTNVIPGVKAASLNVVVPGLASTSRDCVRVVFGASRMSTPLVGCAPAVKLS